MKESEHYPIGLKGEGVLYGMSNRWIELRQKLQSWKPRWTVDDWWGLTDRFEKAVGSILVQNTSWQNAYRGVESMRQAGLMTPDAILAATESRLQAAVRPAGFYRAKSAACRRLSRWVADRGGLEEVRNQKGDTLREDLLAIKGIGPETADMILLYVLDHPTFIGDAYTRRIALRLFGSPELSYEQVRSEVLEAIRETEELGLFHALLVELGKDHCRKRRPLCDTCPVRRNCVYDRERSSLSL
ncbi:hypothetical protein CHM34_10200 [Paludifilum halophilum]|uniref:HhH-GPD domain-containing protein n=1 Tax=Paludifilum halophilum TaxID=1642702 RepID=A0A235B771_9BACL|nr:hypothetical protein CHM34_10200 [Paludifilum halophilum]